MKFEWTHPEIAQYKERFDLGNAHFSQIDHAEAMVATVFKVTLENGTHLILKIYGSASHYLREIYFLSFFAGKLPVPRLVHMVPPETDVDGAVLMEYIPGALLEVRSLNGTLCYEIGSLLARIHLERAESYGDLVGDWSADPSVPFTAKFEEELEECQGVLPGALIDRSRRYFKENVHLLAAIDGPCVIHRDFRLGNLIGDQGKVRGIIDWSSARWGFAEEDFYLLESDGWAANSAFRESFLAGYASVRKVPAYKGVLPLVRVSRAIGAIGFTVTQGTWQSKGKGAKLYQSNRQYLEALLGGGKD